MDEQEYREFLADTKDKVSSMIAEPANLKKFRDHIKPLMEEGERYFSQLNKHLKKSEEAAKKKPRLRKKTKKPPQKGMIWHKSFGKEKRKGINQTMNYSTIKADTYLMVGGKAVPVKNGVAVLTPKKQYKKNYNEGYWMLPFKKPIPEFVNWFPDPELSALLEFYISENEPEPQPRDLNKDEKLMIYYVLLAIIHDAQSTEAIDERIYFDLRGDSDRTWADQMAGVIWLTISDLSRKMKSGITVAIEKVKADLAAGTTKAKKRKRNVKDLFTFASNQAFFDKKDLELPAGRPIKMLHLLVNYMPKIVSFSEVNKAAEQRESNQAEETTRAYIAILRKALKKHKVPCTIEAKIGAGYLMKSVKRSPIKRQHTDK